MPEGSLKARDSQGSNKGLWMPGYVALPKSKKALPRKPIRPRSKGNAIIKRSILLKDPRTL
jgi:hypothetical protein